MPNVRVKLVVNEPTLCRPTDEADVRDRAVGDAQQRRRALEPARQQVRVRRLAEGAPELAAEVRAREAGRAGQVVDAERLEVARVGEVPGAQQVAGGRDEALGIRPPDDSGARCAGGGTRPSGACVRPCGRGAAPSPWRAGSAPPSSPRSCGHLGACRRAARSHPRRGARRFRSRFGARPSRLSGQSVSSRATFLRTPLSASGCRASCPYLAIVASLSGSPWLPGDRLKRSSGAASQVRALDPRIAA